MTDFTGLYNIREYRQSDRNFILGTFINGLHSGNSWFNMIPASIYFEEYRRVIEHIVDSPNVIINMACLPDDPDTILGYSILSSDFQTVHWVHVKKRWRNRGIARSLTPKHPKAVSHLSELGKSLLSKLNGAIFNPFNLP